VAALVSAAAPVLAVAGGAAVSAGGVVGALADGGAAGVFPVIDPAVWAAAGRAMDRARAAAPKVRMDFMRSPIGLRGLPRMFQPDAALGPSKGEVKA
jgi:hypothetical protein